MSLSDIEQALYAEFEDDILIRGNSLFVPYKSVGKLLEKVHSSSLGICGIDVFRVEKGTFTPIDIADYSGALAESWNSYKSITYNTSLSFIKLQPELDSTYFEFVFVSEREWSDAKK